MTTETVITLSIQTLGFAFWTGIQWSRLTDARAEIKRLRERTHELANKVIVVNDLDHRVDRLERLVNHKERL